MSRVSFQRQAGSAGHPPNKKDFPVLQWMDDKKDGLFAQSIASICTETRLVSFIGSQADISAFAVSRLETTA